MRRWYTSDEILAQLDMQPFELINLIRNGTLQPYRMDAVKETKIKQYFTPDEIRLMVQCAVNNAPIPDTIQDRISKDIELEHYDEKPFENGSSLRAFLSGLIFKADEVNLLSNHDAKKKVLDREAKGYVDQSRREKVDTNVIAFNLKNVYGWKYLDIARTLNMCKDLNTNQVDAMKQRGRRACIKGEKICNTSNKK
jgi:hypothetical protein